MKMTEADKLIDCVKRQGRSTLTEAESKTFLNFYGVSVVEEVKVTTVEEATLQSEKIGYPVVLKGLGAKLTHKTELGLVKLNLRAKKQIRSAFRDIKESAKQDWEGCLIQPFIDGKRELVAGLFRDAQFGPVIMLGLGGIFTEAIGDVVFRIAPLKDVYAKEMMEELKSRKLLENFRGESAVDRDQLLQVLIGLSQVGMEYPEIREVDINPLIIMPDGRITAVDALVALDENYQNPNSSRVNENDVEKRAEAIRAALDAMTHAKAVAVVGATDSSPLGAWPGIFRSMHNFGFSGRLYPVNPVREEMDGVRSYPDLVSLPEPVDLVIICISAPLVADVLRDCVASGNKNVHIYTAGFGETGVDERIHLQEEIEGIARKGGLNVLGPNCMGFYVPSTLMVTWADASRESGCVSMLSQSGGNVQDFTYYLSDRYRIHFSKVMSYGNALTLDGTDFLDYLAYDEETRIITMYMEGVKDGRRLLDLATKISQKKPIICYKGGLSKAGARAAASHTGSLAGSQKIWRAFFRQSGVVQVDSLEEMADVTLIFHHIRETSGNKIALLAMGGGVSVAVSDSCAAVGLDLPALSEQTLKRMRILIQPAGNSIRNPIDALPAFMDLNIMGQIVGLLASSKEIDNIIVFIYVDLLFGGNQIEKIAVFLAQEGRKRANGKPLIVAYRQYRPHPEIRKCSVIMEDILLAGGIPVYKGLRRAVVALSKFTEYHAFLNRSRRND